MSIRVGIVVGHISAFKNWELRVIQALVAHPKIELICINLPAVESSRTELGSVLLRTQRMLEQRFLLYKYATVDAQEITEALEKNPIINLHSKTGLTNAQLAEDDKNALQKAALDVLISFQPTVLDTIVSYFTYGVWEFSFSHTHDTAPVGFWEVLQKKEGIGFGIVANSSTLGKRTVATAFFNRGWYMAETAQIAQEGSVSCFNKVLKNLVEGTLVLEDKPTALPQQYTVPTIGQELQYVVRFYATLSAKMCTKVKNACLGKRQERWSLFLGNGRFLDADLSQIKPLPMPKNEFWADPFLFRYQGKEYLFFENYSYLTKKGKISCGRIENSSLVEVADVLKFDYHLSFPYVFEEDGEVYLMPETAENKRLELYKATNFPTKWELHATAFEGEAVADAFFYTDEDRQKWLFVNKQASAGAPINSELFVYRVHSLALKQMEPHKQNPVLIDARIARSGGCIFKQNGCLYRPSQRNVDAVYGRALNINRIEILTIDTYIEKTVRVIEPAWDNRLMALHHVHQLDNIFVFDAAYKSK